MIELPDGRQIGFDERTKLELVSLLQQGPGSHMAFGRKNVGGNIEVFLASFDGERVLVEYYQTRQETTGDSSESGCPFGSFIPGGELVRIPGSTQSWDWTPSEVVSIFKARR